MHGVQAISRKDSKRFENPQRLYARPVSERDETVRSAWRHAEPDGNDLALAEAGVTPTNGPKVAFAALVKPGHVLERLSISGYSPRKRQ